MASKGMKNLLKAFKNRSPAEAQQTARQNLANAHEFERKMNALLAGIDLYNPRNRLSAEKCRALNIDGVIRYAAGELQHSTPIDRDLTDLDKNMIYIVHALNAAVEEGMEMTAEWACTALVFAIKNLRTEVDGIDQDYADALWQRRVEYSENLVLLVKSCIEHDRLSDLLNELCLRRQQEHSKLDQRQSRYQARRDSGALDMLLAELEMKAHTPALLSLDALMLRDELEEIHMLKKNIVEIDAAIDAKRSMLTSSDREIMRLRNALSMAPQPNP